LSKLIVHVDDDKDIRTAVKRILLAEGYDVLSYETIENFMADLDKLDPALIILDVMVENEDSGLSAFSEISENFPHIPIIILTTLGEMILPYFDDRKDLICILEKPVLAEKLIDIIHSRMSPGVAPDRKGKVT